MKQINSSKNRNPAAHSRTSGLCRGAHENEQVMLGASRGEWEGAAGGAPCHRGVAVLGTDPGNARPTRSRDFPTKTLLVPPTSRLPSPEVGRLKPLIVEALLRRARAHTSALAHARQIRQAQCGIWAKFKSHLSCLESFRERKLRQGPNVELCPPTVETCVVDVV